MPAVWTAPKNWNVGELLIASDFNAQLRDNMEWLKSRPFDETAVATTSTTSTSFAAVSGASATITTVGGNVLLIASGSIANSAAGNINLFDWALGTSRYGDATNGLCYIYTPVANYYDLLTLIYMTSTPPPAGSNTFNLYWRTSAGTLTWGTGGIGHVYAMEIR